MMNRPRNRQSRPPRNNINSANAPNRTPRSSVPNNVPTTQQVKPGASVSIVLKADQRTGREVQGAVKDVLTRGNHPHGIKVRLQDERVGRVQRMMGNVSTRPNLQPAPEPDMKPEIKPHVNPEVKQEIKPEIKPEIKAAPDIKPEPEIKPDMKPKPPAGRARSRNENQPSQRTRPKHERFATDNENQGNRLLSIQGSSLFSSAVVQCPICGDFEGDVSFLHTTHP